jgi:hypothetical protein
MAKRNTDSGLPNVRIPGKALKDAQAEAPRCTATEGAQRCLKEQHSGIRNHTWGPRGETSQWNADGTPKGIQPDAVFVPPPGVGVNTTDITETLPTVSPRDDGQATADPTPDVPSAPTGTLEPSGTGTLSSPAEPSGSDTGGSGRPSLGEMQAKELAMAERRVAAAKADLGKPPPHTTRSIGTVIANHALLTADGVPEAILDEKAHGREATELLLVAAAEHWRHNELMPYPRLLDLQAVVEHMVEARGVGR